MDDVPTRFLSTLATDDVDSLNDFISDNPELSSHELHQFAILTILSNCVNSFKLFVRLLDEPSLSMTSERHSEPLLHTTVLHQRQNMAKFLLENGYDVNSINDAKETPLMIASRIGCLDLITMLLREDPDVAVRDQKGRAVFHLLARSGSVGCMAEMLKHVTPNLHVMGSLINSRDIDGMTVLMYASIDGHVEMVSQLVDVGADVNIVDDRNKTACHWAARRGHKACVEMLLSHGADITARDCDKRTPLVLAVERGHRVVLNYTLTKYEEMFFKSSKAKPKLKKDLYEGLPYRQQFDLKMALIASVAEGHAACTELLLDVGTPVDCSATSTSDGNFVPISLDEHKVGASNVMKELSFTSDSTWQCRSLHIASARTNHICCKLLLDRGADPNQVDSDGNTPLVYAVGKGDLEIVKELLSHNADPDINGNVCGITCSPFDVAATYGSMKIMLCLAVSGAKINVSADWMNSKGSDACDHVHHHALYAGKISWLCDFVCHPKPLQEHCRYTLRKLLGNNIHGKIKSLSLPRTLKDILSIKELNDIN
ncbi:unnamed protein product [Owenia fusiformis]|uniref:Uncharacterized protein n=1 Tax=Owenia fusiformis TaxID=6347 RepID=A0A8J1Y9V6_OWEFU|nr:unnamed protein product [Owenia fusiformis]